MENNGERRPFTVLIDARTLPNDPSEMGYIIRSIVYKNIAILKHQGFMAAVIGVDFKAIAELGKAANAAQSKEDLDQLDNLKSPMKSLFLTDDYSLIINPGLIEGLMEAHTDVRYFLIVSTTEEYLMIRSIKSMDLNLLKEIREQGEQINHDSGTCEVPDCKICELERKHEEELFNDIETAQIAYQSVLDADFEVNQKDKEEMLHPDEAKDIANNLGEDDIPVIDDEDEDDLFE
jgi:hypothetical protein